MISVLIVEDNWVWASAVENRIGREQGMRHAATTASVDEALRIAHDGRVTVALVDLLLGAESGLRFARVCQARSLPTKVVLMSIEPNTWAVDQARRAGVAGFIHKEDLETGSEVVSFIRRIANGETLFTERVASMSSTPAELQGADLTPQELELIRCLRNGMNTEEISRHLSVGAQTVRNKVGAIGKKLGVSGRVEILAWHTANGFGRPERALR